MLRMGFAGVGILLLVAGTAIPASADLVFLTSGRALSVRGYVEQGDTIVLRLRGGGEARFEKSLVARIEPDEVPYPEPPPERVASEQASLPSQSIGDVPYAELIDRLATAQGVDPDLVKALIKVESGYNARARSRKGAMGLMQIMPATARQYALRNPYDPRANLKTGITHLASLLRRFEVSVALAAYNAGEEAVRRFGGMPPYRETQAYVRRIMALAPQ